MGAKESLSQTSALAHGAIKMSRMELDLSICCTINLIPLDFYSGNQIMKEEMIYYCSRISV